MRTLEGCGSDMRTHIASAHDYFQFQNVAFFEFRLMVCIGGLSLGLCARHH
jgi:hypothetical protein